jgi:hypothetical protein
MQITVDVPDEIMNEAASRDMTANDFVQTLIARGFETVKGRVNVNSAIERIRALRSAPSVAGQ